MNTEVNHLIERFGLQRMRLPILRAVRDCVGFQLVETEDTPSRFGGRARVPANFEWPVLDGRPLDFLLQVELRDLNLVWNSGLLPPEGSLAFFYDLDSMPWGFDPKLRAGYRVAYFGPDQPLGEPEPPHDFALAHRCMSFFRAVSVPVPGSRAFTTLSEATGLTDDEHDRYWDFSRTVPEIGRPPGCGTTHQFFGHSLNVQGDMQLEAQLVSHGLYCGDGTGYEDPRCALLEPTCEDWQLLLQLDSDDAAEVMWGDEGLLYYWIRSQDLSARRFDQIWGTLQCY